MSLERFYRIRNHEDGYHHVHERVRQYRYELVDEYSEYWGCYIYGLFRYEGALRRLQHQRFYYVKDDELSDPWWRKPSYPEQLEIKARYPDAVF